MKMDREVKASAAELAQHLFASRTPLMLEVARLVRLAIAYPLPVLLCGPSGTGKERVARTIHEAGPRRGRPFVAVNCGALTDTLLEAEMFGHRQGSFTGAFADRAGVFEAADGGTVFLDEIGESPLPLQIKLLRVLESGEILAVGATQPRRVEVRVIAATHRDIEADITNGRFRSDLYYRINTLPIHLPALAQRREDIVALAQQLLSASAGRLGKATAGFSQAALVCLQRYAWPGNVRELQNEIERACALLDHQEAIEVGHLSPKLRGSPAPAAAAPAGTTLRRARYAFEEQFIRQTLERHNGNAAAAARTLGLSRSMLQRKIRLFGLRRKADAR